MSSIACLLVDLGQSKLLWVLVTGRNFAHVKKLLEFLEEVEHELE